MTFITPVMLRSICRCQSSNLTSSIGEISWTPALLNTRSTGPSSSASCSAAAVTADRSVTSRGRGRAVPAAAVMRAARASSLSERRAATATLAPRVANRNAVASPIPLEAPVTMAPRPANGVVVITADMSFIPFAGVRVSDCSAICSRSTAQMKSATSADARVWTSSRVLFIARCVHGPARQIRRSALTPVP
jgi:hypothetical protein